jgi:2-polyprenyl-6-methoxyphenol hydroxylase-like FAD-dependent oxidoreductase
LTKAADDFDVVVIGGGPGGAATAGLLAKRGHRVLVLEREKFPRYHIGESLITGVLPAIEELGLRQRLDEKRTATGRLLVARASPSPLGPGRSPVCHGRSTASRRPAADGCSGAVIIGKPREPMGGSGR